jgi:TonB family protein
VNKDVTTAFQRYVPAAVFAMFSLFVASAEAENTPGITPPVVQNGTDVPYPEGAHGDASVLLEVEVDKGGAVSSAVVTEGAEPFAERARRAVLGWRFAPALRDGVPVAARIRARVTFSQVRSDNPNGQISAAESAPRPPTAETPTPAPTTLPAPDEVTVHGARREIGETTLLAADVREMPGAFGDPFRGVEALPGVVPVVSGLPFFYIRGAPPNDNQYLLDGIRVPLLFHVGIGEGVIHPKLIDRIDFYPGAAPAAYGGAAGAVIAGQTRAPSSEPHRELNLRLIDAGALIESPFAEGRGSMLVAGRYGYPGPIIGAITNNVALGYWDYQARGTFRLGSRDAVGIFAFGSHDYLGTADTKNGVVGPIVEQVASDFHRVDLRYDHELDGGHLRVAGTLGYDSQGGAGEGDNSAVTTVTNLSAALRLEVDDALSSAVRVRGGADAWLDHYRFAQGQAPTGDNGTAEPQVPSSANPPPTNFTGDAHADVVWRVTPRVELVPGVRANLFASRRASGPSGADVNTIVPAIDPRLSARVTLAPSVAWLSALGLSHQYPALRVGAIPAMLVSVPGFPVGDAHLQSVAQASQGIEIALPADFTLTTTGFFSEWWGLTDLTGNCIQIMPATMPPTNGMPPPPSPYLCPNNQPVRGVAYGVEFLLRRPLTKRLSGWLSYTLSRSTREEHFVTATGGDAMATVASSYDRTHALNAIVAYDLGRRWRAGARFLFLSGTPYSNLAGNVPVPPYNSQRDPPFFRLDVRLEKRWPLGEDGYIAFIAEGQNVTLSKETTPFGLKCIAMGGPQGGTTQCMHSAFGPITIPSVGVEASF